MSHTIRSLFAKALVGGALLAPFAVPAFAQNAAPQNAVSQGQKKTAKELHAVLLKSTGWIQARNGDQILSHGTGWIVDAERKLMVTNDHVVEGQDTVYIVFPKYENGKLMREEKSYNGEKGVKAVVIDRDRNRDLAVIQLQTLPEGLVALPVANEEPEEGDSIRTIGGFTNGGDGLVFGGVGGEVRSVGDTGGLHKLGKVRTITSTVPINGGNSGGPLIDETGILVGVNSYSVLRGIGGREVIGVSGHISVAELKGYLKEVDPLVSPKNAGEFTKRGERKLNASRLDAAIKDFSAAIEKEGANANALYLRGKAFTKMGDARTALDDLNAAIKIEGKYDYRIARGDAYRVLGKQDEAMDDYSGAIRTDPSLPLGYNQRGVSYCSLKKFEDAEADFQRAVEKAPNVALFLSNRAEAKFGQKKYESAAQDWAKAAELEPWNPEYPSKVGNAMFNFGKPLVAAEIYLGAAQKFGNPVFLRRASAALLEAKEHKQSVKIASEALKAYGDKGAASEYALLYWIRGVSQRELKNAKDAIDDLTKAIDYSGGKNGMMYLDRGLAHQTNGASNAAEDDLKMAEKLGVKVGEVKAAVSPIAGKWKCTTFINGVKMVGEAEFKTNGTFEGGWTASNQFGSQTSTDTGTWKLEKNKLTIKCKDTGAVIRMVEISEDEVTMSIEEFGKNVTFSREK